MKPTLATGCKAYFETKGFGMIPCIVVTVKGYSVRAKLTASRGEFDTYRRGEIIETTPLHCFPRKCVRRGRILAYAIAENGPCA